MAKTKDNTTLLVWWRLANKAFVERGMTEPNFGEAHDAYEVGESPETWAEYVLHSNWRPAK